MNNMLKKYGWLIAALLGFAIWSAIQYGQYQHQRINPCVNETPEMLVKRYPDLQSLQLRQRERMQVLMGLHREQEMSLNAIVGDEVFSAEQAIQISMKQVAEIAVLRERQAEEFKIMCLVHFEEELAD